MVATVIDGGAGTDTLSLAGGDDISLASVTSFENLVIAFNGGVTMTNAQHNMFVGASTVATGNNTMNITNAFAGSTTMAQVENYVLGPVGGDTADHAYTINYDGQKVTDNDTAGSNTATLKAGIDGVTLIATASANYTVNLDNNTNVNITLDLTDTVVVAGTITGTVNADAGTDLLSLKNGADISGATIMGFENLTLETNGTFTMTAAQYIALTGGVVTATGFETVIITTNSGSTISSVGPIEGYVLASGLNDTFQYNIDPAFFATNTLDITAGGNDTLILQNTTLFELDEHITTTGFSTGVGADKIASRTTAESLTDGTFQTMIAADDLLATTDHFVVNTSLFNPALTNPSDFAQVRAAVAFAVDDNLVERDYTVALYDAAGNADIYQMHIKASGNVVAGDITVVDYAAQLTGVAVNTLIGTNFVP